MKSLEFDKSGFEDLKEWVDTDRKKASKIMKLIIESQKTPFDGTGKPEALKYELSGCWSREIDQKNRLIYQVLEEKIVIISCKGHYD